MVETTDDRRQTTDDDVRERESCYTIDPDDISRCRQDQKIIFHQKKSKNEKKNLDPREPPRGPPGYPHSKFKNSKFKNRLGDP